MNNESKHEVRETEIWNRSAEQHDKNGQPVAALLSRHLAWQAQRARIEYQEIRQAAERQHTEARERQ